MIRFTAEERQLMAEARKLQKRERAPVEKSKIVLPKRPSVSPARKLRIHTAHEGKCHVCGSDVPVLGPEVQYDHVKERAFEGSDGDENMAPICTVPCHAEKTAAFLTTLAKADRQRAFHEGSKRKPTQKINSPGFPNQKRAFGQ